MKIAVVGSGISGLSAAYFLSKKHRVDLFEKEDHFGGHSFTVEIPLEKENKKISVDIGFIVFNKITYPNLLKLFDELKVPYEKSNMSFSVSVKNSNIEYSGGSGLSGLFANKLNFFNYKFVKMILEIISFYNAASKLDQKSLETITLGDFLKLKKKTNYFINFHILPMVAAIWSIPSTEAKQIPIVFFINFFKNHGLFKLKNRPQWYTVTGRSKNYVNKILSQISGEYFKNYPIKKIKRNHNSVSIFYGSSEEYFDYDHVIVATHADQALKLIENPTNRETQVLSNFKYNSNVAYLHYDKNFMPKRKQAWSSWNSIIDKFDQNKNSITYWLNKLQNLKTDKNIFLTLNPIEKINETYVIRKVEFTHPFYNQNTIIAQKKINEIQGIKKIWFCGSYFGYGFHEDGIKSSLEMTKLFND